MSKPLTRYLFPLPFIFCFVLLANDLTAAPETIEQGKELERLWSPIEKQSKALCARDIMGFALEAEALSWHPERVAQSLTVLEKMQDLAITSKTYGNFCWYHGSL